MVGRSPRVVVGFHHWGLVHAKFAWALARAVAYEGNRIERVLEFGSPYTDEARNKLVEAFLAMPGGSADYFLMVDADIEFEKDAISKTMWVAQNFNADCVWGNYALGSFTNSLFTKAEDSFWGAYMPDLKPDMIYDNIYAGGTGWLLVTREWLEKMKKGYEGPWHWFERVLVENNKMATEQSSPMVKLGEDMSFGHRAWKLGAKQIGYTGIVLIHHKSQPTIPQFMAPVLQSMNTNVLHMLTPAGAQRDLPEEASLGEKVVIDHSGVAIVE